MAAKDAMLADKKAQWEARWFWSLDRAGNKISTEVKIMYDLRSRNGSGYVVQILNWRHLARLKT